MKKKWYQVSGKGETLFTDDLSGYEDGFDIVEIDREPGEFDIVEDGKCKECPDTKKRRREEAEDNKMTRSQFRRRVIGEMLDVLVAEGVISEERAAAYRTPA